MNELVEHSGIIVLATHHQKLAQEACNLGLYIQNGQVVEYGEIEHCWSRYNEDAANGSFDRS